MLREAKCLSCGKSRQVCRNHGERCWSCAKYVQVWGEKGFSDLKQLAARDDDLTYAEVEVFARKFGKSVRGVRRTIKQLGYKGTHERKNAVYGPTKHLTKNTRSCLAQVCVVCRAIEDIEAHHILPLEWGGEDSIKNLEMRCLQCHRKEHARIHAAIRAKYRYVWAFKNIIMQQHRDLVINVLFGDELGSAAFR